MRLRLFLPVFAAFVGAGVLICVLAAHNSGGNLGTWESHSVNGMRYDVLLPADYEPRRCYPIVLYLHQLEMGNYPPALIAQVNYWFNTPAYRWVFPTIVVMPMLDQKKDPTGMVVNFGGKPKGRVGEENSIAALHAVMAKHLVDTQRIYVTGNSLGGIGTWQMLLDYNAWTGRKERIFAAGIPLAGENLIADPGEAATSLARVPIWTIHGAQDQEQPLTWDRDMAQRMAGQRTYRYTEDPSLGHNVWDHYYVKASLWQWLFAQRAPAILPVGEAPESQQCGVHRQETNPVH